MTVQPFPLPSNLQGPWVPVMVAKVGQDGKALRNDKGDVIEKRRLLDARTGDLYNDDFEHEVWVKSMLIPFGLSFYTAAQMIWSAGRFFIDVPAIAFRAISSFVEDWRKGEDIQKLKDGLLNKITEIPHRIVTNIRHFVTAPFFALGVLATAAYGIINPFEGRKWEAKVEHMWEDNASFKEDFRLKKMMAKAFHLAFCFQPLGNLSEQRHCVTWWDWRGSRNKHKHEY